MSLDPLSVTGVVLGIPGVIDLCIKYGQFLKEKVETYRNVEEIARLQKFVVQLVEGELFMLLNFFHSVATQSTVSFPGDTLTLFQILRGHLEAVSQLIPNTELGVVRKLTFSFRGKKAIDKACQHLEQWHTRFLRRAVVFLFFGPSDLSNPPEGEEREKQAISRIRRIRSALSGSEYDQEKAQSAVRLDAFAYNTNFIPLEETSNLYLIEGQEEVVEFRQYDASADPVAINRTRIVTRSLAIKLSLVDAPLMGLLTCKGYSEDRVGHRLALRFLYPVGMCNPRTLQQLLTHPSNKKPGIQHSLSDRIALAVRVVSAVLYLHSCDFVHKNIRPRNILIFEPGSVSDANREPVAYPKAIGQPFLVGFDNIRQADASSRMVREEEWQKNIYLPPQRHRMEPGDEFTMQHDIYSLGVVLLEIALWGSFTDIKGIGKHLWKSLEPGKEQIRDVEDLMALYIRLARSQIPRALGNRYRDVVVSCLIGLQDEENQGLLNDQDGLIVGSAYISQIMTKLEDIKI